MDRPEIYADPYDGSPGWNKVIARPWGRSSIAATLFNNRPEWQRSLLIAFDYLSGILQEKKAVIAGGAARRMFEPAAQARHSKSMRDVDVFFSDLLDIRSVCQKLQSKTHGFKEEETTDNAITLIRSSCRIQLIWLRPFASVQDLFDDFDYTICQFALSHDSAFMTPLSIADLVSRRLRLNHAKSTECALGRMFKFDREGFHMSSTDRNELFEKAIKEGLNIAEIQSFYEDWSS